MKEYVRLDENGDIVLYPVTNPVNILRKEDIACRDNLSDEVLAEYHFYPVTQTEAPSILVGQKVEVVEPVLEDDEWVQTWEVTDLPYSNLLSVKEEFRSNITAILNTKFNAGYTPTSGPLSGNTLQTATVEDRTNWLTSQASYAAAISLGHGSVEDASFRTVNNETITVSYNEGMNILLGMAAWGKSLMSHSWTLKDLVDGALSFEDLRDIDIESGWPT